MPITNDVRLSPPSGKVNGKAMQLSTNGYTIQNKDVLTKAYYSHNREFQAFV
jgi:hypothetical protein